MVAMALGTPLDEGSYKAGNTVEEATTQGLFGIRAAPVGQPPTRLTAEQLRLVDASARLEVPLGSAYRRCDNLLHRPPPGCQGMLRMPLFRAFTPCSCEQKQIQRTTERREKAMKKVLSSSRSHPPCCLAKNPPLGSVQVQFKDGSVLEFNRADLTEQDKVT